MDRRGEGGGGEGRGCNLESGLSGRLLGEAACLYLCRSENVILHRSSQLYDNHTDCHTNTGPATASLEFKY